MSQQSEIVVGYLASEQVGFHLQLQSHFPDHWTVVPMTPANLSDAQLLPRIRYLVVAGSKLSRDVIQQASSLRFVHKQGVGYDDIDLQALRDLNIPLAICPLGSAAAVAEQAVALALSALKSIPYLNHAVKGERRWPRWEVRDRLRQLANEKVGIVGYGRIGQRVSELFSAFGCEVLVHSRSARDLKPPIRLEHSLEMLFEYCSVVSLHLPLTAETHGLVGEHLLTRLGPRGILIHTARGPIVDQPALVRCLKDGLLGFAAVDVLTQEPPKGDDEILGLPNILITPHLGGGGVDVIHRKLGFIASNILALHRGEPILELV
jgi:phosphoglycerate dehydrogenase-like enzyme